MEVLVPTISTLVSAMVPSDNMLVRMHAGALAGEAFRYTIKKTSTLSSWIPTLFRTNQLFISQGMTDERHANPVFEQMQEFIVAKHFAHLTTAQLIPKKGEITLYPRQGLKLTETFQGHKLDIAMTYGPTEEGHPDVTKTSYHTQIVLSSRTLKVEQLKEFVQTICKLDRVLHSTIVVFRPIVQRGKRDESNFVEWDKIFMKTNKTLENTIYSEIVVKQLFDDVEWFINNEEWFKTRGMSYKRGYVMHGPPGVGKTSVAKILANKYHLPIFVLDLQSLESNSDFNKLVTEINYLTDQRYIISIEDLDRTEMFRNKWYGDNGKCVSVQCFLNFLDGVVETHGRICIFSANDMSVLDNHPSSTAMFRPGRIDCRIEITHCNKTQLSKLFQLYYGEDVSEDTIKTTAVISPAQFLNIMTKCTQTEVLDYLQSNEKADLASDADLAIQGLLGEGGAKEGNGIKRKRCSNRGRCAKHPTPLARIKQKQRDLDRMEKAIQSSIKKSDKIRESLMVQVEKMAEDKTKVTQKEEALLAQQKEGYSVVKASSRGVVLKRSRVK